MARSIKKIVHDLKPLSNSCTELSKIISQLLHGVQSHTNFVSPQVKKHFDECVTAAEKMAISASLIERYIQDLSKEI